MEQKELEIFISVDDVLYSVKPYDYFERIYIYLYQSLTNNLKNYSKEIITHFLDNLQEEFDEICFMLLLNNNYIYLRPSTNFLYCLFAFYQKIRFNLFNQIEIISLIDNFMEDLQKNLNFFEDEYKLFTKLLIK